MPNWASRADQITPSGRRLATVFTRFTDKKEWALNNGKARRRQCINGSKHKLGQADDSLASVPQMRNGCDALLVPQGRQNREEKPGQPGPPQLRRAAIRPSGPGEPQISDRKRAVVALRRHNLEAPIPDDVLARPEPERRGGFGELARHQNTLSPASETAPAQGMSALRGRSEYLSQPSDPLAPRWIGCTADRDGYPGEKSFRYVRRGFREHSGIEEGEAGRMQADIPRKNGVLVTLAGRPHLAEPADLGEQAGGIGPVPRRAAILPQSSPLENRVKVARIGYEELPLRLQERQEPVPRDAEQRAQQSAVPEFTDHGHPCEPVRAAMSPFADQICLDLIIPM